MDQSHTKCVVVIDDSLPRGIIANTAAILGITLGRCAPELTGPDVRDHSGQDHRGIVVLPVPILKADRSMLRDLRKKLCDPQYAELTAVDFSETAQRCHEYKDYIEAMARTVEDDLDYLGLAIIGEKKLIGRLTGSMPLLR